MYFNTQAPTFGSVSVFLGNTDWQLQPAPAPVTGARLLCAAQRGQLPVRAWSRAAVGGRRAACVFRGHDALRAARRGARHLGVAGRQVRAVQGGSDYGGLHFTDAQGDYGGPAWNRSLLEDNANKIAMRHRHRLKIAVQNALQHVPEVSLSNANKMLPALLKKWVFSDLLVITRVLNGWREQ